MIKKIIGILSILSLTSVYAGEKQNQLTINYNNVLTQKQCAGQIIGLVNSGNLSATFDTTNAPAKPGDDGTAQLININNQSVSVTLNNEGLKNLIGLSSNTEQNLTFNNKNFTLKYIYLLGNWGSFTSGIVFSDECKIAGSEG